MPDLINPEITKTVEFIRWADELCSSCKCKDNHCPLIVVLGQVKIMTHSGIHVSDCDLYDPDTDSKYYLPPNADQDMVNAMNIEVARQSLSAMRKLMNAIETDKDGVD
jgi:hypothetical protein